MVFSNNNHMLFYLFILQKRLQWQISVHIVQFQIFFRNFCKCSWFGTFWCLYTFLFCFKTKVLLSIWIRIKYVGVVVVLFVAPKDVELKLFFLGVSNYCELSLSLISGLIWLLVLWSNTENAKSYTTIAASQALMCWVCEEVSRGCGET